MELKAFRRRRVQEAMKDSNVQILIASLPQNIAYLTGGYVSVGQNVLCSSQAYVAYLLPEGKLYCIVGHAEIPPCWSLRAATQRSCLLEPSALHTPILFRSRQIFRV